jgi:hypothetical protein
MHFNSTPLIDVNGDTANAWWDFVVFHTEQDRFRDPRDGTHLRGAQEAGRCLALHQTHQCAIWRFDAAGARASAGAVKASSATTQRLRVPL